MASIGVFAVEWGQTPLSATFRGRPTPFDTVRLWVSASELKGV